VHKALALLVLVVGLAAVTATPSAAKEGVQARLVTPIPRDALPGTRVVVVWTLASVDDGERILFGASGVFIRLFGPGTARTARAYGTELVPGRFRAGARIPAGGVRRLVIGLMGTGCDANGCRPSPHLFRIVGPVFR
jgi:hypothetical protein